MDTLLLSKIFNGQLIITFHDVKKSEGLKLCAAESPSRARLTLKDSAERGYGVQGERIDNLNYVLNYLKKSQEETSIIFRMILCLS